jgi:transketolase
MLGTSGVFGVAALDLVELDSTVEIITADLTYFSGLERFINTYPDKCLNVGIAEQNMVGVASGMAKEGFKPYLTSYATFITSRCADQIRVNLGYMKNNVKLIGLGAGLAVGILGPTHMGFEDISVIRSIPNMIILSPSDSLETYKCLLESLKSNSPMYIRLTGQQNNPIVYSEDYKFEIGKNITLKEGNDIVIFATGTMVHKAMQVSDILRDLNISVKVINVHTIKPFDIESVISNMDKKLIVSIEEHSVTGGLGTAISEVLSNSTNHGVLLRIGFSDNYVHAGSYEHLLNHYGLDTISIQNKILEKFKEIL